MKQSRKRLLVWTAASAVFVAFVAWAFWPRAMPVEIGSVHRGPLVVTLDEEGETRVRERYVVSAPVPGRVLRIELEAGDPVVAGETVLAVFQPAEPILLDARGRAEAEAQVRAARAEHEAAKHRRDAARAELEFARVEAGRIGRLAAEDVVSAERRDAARLAERQAAEALEAAVHAVESASFRLASARARLLDLGGGDRDGSPRRGDDPIDMRAPIDGVVLRVLHESEGVVAVGEPLLELGDPGDLEIVADFLSSDAVRIRAGASVVIDRWGGETPIAGRVARVEPSGFTKISALGVEEQRVNVIIDFADGAVDGTGIGDGFRVEARVVVWQGEDVLQVPAGSLFRTGEGWSVYRVDNGRARLHAVEIGARTPTHVEVLGGFEAGDEVVQHPGDSLAEGTRIRPRAL